MRRIVAIRAVLLFVVVFYAGLQVMVHMSSTVEVDAKAQKKAQLTLDAIRGKEKSAMDAAMKKAVAGARKKLSILGAIEKMKGKKPPAPDTDAARDQEHVLYQLEHGEDMPEPHEQETGANKERRQEGKAMAKQGKVGPITIEGCDKDQGVGEAPWAHFSVEAYDQGNIFSFRPHRDKSVRYDPVHHDHDDYVPEDDVVVLDQTRDDLEKGETSTPTSEQEKLLLTQKNGVTYASMWSEMRSKQGQAVDGDIAWGSVVDPSNVGADVTDIHIDEEVGRHVGARAQVWCGHPLTRAHPYPKKSYMARYTTGRQDGGSVVGVNSIDIFFKPEKNGGDVDILFKQQHTGGRHADEHDTTFQEGKGEEDGRVSFYGLAMRGTSTELPWDQEVTLKNLDLNHYSVADPTLGMYGIIPFVYAVIEKPLGGSGDIETIGFFWLHGSPSHVTAHAGSPGHEGAKLTFDGTEGGSRLFVLRGPTPAHVLNQYYKVTGKPALPPLFSLGYHQCRWTYKDQADVLAVNQGFDSHNLPCDAIWLDIDHTDDKKYFTWDGRKFPDSLKMQRELWEKNKRHMVTITDPHIKVQRGYHVWQEAHDRGFFIKDERGHDDFRGHCWPGESSWIDYSNPEARRWYAGLFDLNKYQGSTMHLFSWIDMNEPSVFSGPQITMPMEKLQHNNVRHGLIHNLYGFYHSMATFQGHLHRSKSKERPFLLTRSFFAGSQRFAAVWSGDNQAKWDHIEASLFHILQMAMSGMPFVGADVGGFFDNPDPLMAQRWYQLGSLYPFFRGHAHEATRRREPWLFPHTASIKVADALRFRYVLLPYIYTAFQEASVGAGDGASGLAVGVMQPLMFQFPDDISSYSVTRTFALGSSLIASPILGGDSRYQLHVPRELSSDSKGDAHGKQLRYETLYDFWTGRLVASPQFSHDLRDGNKLDLQEDEKNAVTPLFVRGGKMVPTKETHAASAELLTSVPYRLMIALDAKGEAKGKVYIDDGHSTAYLPQNGGQSCTVNFAYAQDVLTATVDKDLCKYASEDGKQSNGPQEEDRPYSPAVLDSVRIVSLDQRQEAGASNTITKATVIGPTDAAVEGKEFAAVELDEGGHGPAGVGKVTKFMTQVTGLNLSLELGTDSVPVAKEGTEGNEVLLWRVQLDRGAPGEKGNGDGLEG